MFSGPATGDTGDGNSLVTVTALNSTLAGYVTDAQLAQTETNVAQNAASIAANAAAIASLQGSTSASLSAKADSASLAAYATVAQLSGYGSQADVSAAQSASAAAQASVSTLSTSVNASLSQKADQSALDALSATVADKVSADALSAALVPYSTTLQMNSAIAAQAGTTLATVSGAYATQSQVNELQVSLAGKASAADITSALQPYSTTTAVQGLIDSAVAARATSQQAKDAEQDVALAGKAAQSDLTALAATVAQHTADLAGKATSADISTAVAGLASEGFVAAQISSATQGLATSADLASKAQASAVTQLQSDVATKLSAASLSSTLASYATTSALSAVQSSVDAILAGSGGGGGTSIQFVNLQSAPAWEGNVTHPLVVPNSALPIVRDLHFLGSLSATVQNNGTVLSITGAGLTQSEVDAALVPYLLGATAASTYQTLTGHAAAVATLNAAIAERALASSLAQYLTLTDAASTYTTQTAHAADISSITGQLALKADASALGDYLLSATAASTYQTQAAHASDVTALQSSVATKADASALAAYLLSATAASTYQTQAAHTSDITALQSSIATKADASALASYLTTSAAASTYQTQAAHTSDVAALQSSIDTKATPAYVNAQIATLVGSAPAALDTLAELAAALENDANYAATVEAQLASKQPMLSEQPGTGVDLLNGQSTLRRLVAEDGLSASIYLNLADSSDPKNHQVVLSGAALQTSVSSLTTTVATKAAQSDLNALTTTVGTKAAQSDLDALTSTVGTKAGQSDLDALTTTVGTKQDALVDRGGTGAVFIDLGTDNKVSRVFGSDGISVFRYYNFFNPSDPQNHNIQISGSGLASLYVPQASSSTINVDAPFFRLRTEAQANICTFSATDTILETALTCQGAVTCQSTLAVDGQLDVTDNITATGNVSCQNLTIGGTVTGLPIDQELRQIKGAQPDGSVAVNLEFGGSPTVQAAFSCPITAPSATFSGDVNVTGQITSTRVACNFLPSSQPTLLDTALIVPFNTARYNSGHFSASGGVITVNLAGLYHIQWHLTTDVTSGDIRSLSIAYIQRNNVGFTGNRVGMYNRNPANGDCTAGMSMLLELAAGDTLRVLARRENGTNTIRLTTYCGITMIRL